MKFMTRIETREYVSRRSERNECWSPKPGFVDYIHLVVKAVAHALTAITMFANLKPTALHWFRWGTLC
jgi:hypothetical protein